VSQQPLPQRIRPLGWCSVRRKWVVSFALLLLSALDGRHNSFGQTKQDQDEMIWNCCHANNKGAVPDDKTALAIAKAVLGSIYKKGDIESQEPFSATLKDGVWTVSSTLPISPSTRPQLQSPGSVPGGQITEGPLQIRLLQRNGRILSCCFPRDRRKTRLDLDSNVLLEPCHEPV
jgi:hypothetical protein